MKSEFPKKITDLPHVFVLTNNHMNVVSSTPRESPIAFKLKF
jgi:hypothetical protein